MENSENAYLENGKFRFVWVAYHAVMLVAFVIGVYGLFSLFSLASAEIQHSMTLVGSLP